jgi:hypothetical protein
MEANMPSIVRMQRIFSWLIFIAGLFVSILGLGLLGAAPTPRPYQYFTEWVTIIAIGVFGFVPLAASLKALKNRRVAGFIYAGGALALVLYALWIWFSRIDGLRGVAVLVVPVAVLFAILSSFWLLTARRNWPSLIPPSACSWKRVTATVLVGIGMFLIIVAVSVRVSIPGGSAIDCGPSQPFASPKRPGNAVFIARAVVVRGWPAKLMNVEELPFGIVEKQFWGLPGWDKKIILITLPLHDGEVYFVDGRRMQGLLTQFLPVVEVVPCNRTRLLKDATVDLRVLHDGPPRNGVRIIGKVMHDRPWNEAPGVKVLITGPHGTTTTETDKEGIYDVMGLPAGPYTIIADAKPLRLGRNRCQIYADAGVKSGAIWGCELVIE